MIEIQDLAFRYRGNEAYALSGVSLSIPLGAIVGITGPASSGKTTLTRAINGFAAASAGFEPLDEEGINASGMEEAPYAEERSDGIICIGAAQERNRARKGADIKLDLENGQIRLDCHTVYGLSFYRELTDDPDFETTGLDELKADMIEFPFSQASAAADRWKNLSEPFKIPNSDKLVGVKKPVPLK